MRLGLGLGLNRSAGVLGGGGGGGFDFFADSVNGDDGNDGLTAETAKQSLSAVSALMETGSRLALIKGSYWRESLDLSALSGVTVSGIGYGTGDAPVIDGADVVTAWTAEGTANVYQAIVAHDSADTHRGTVYENGTLLTRVYSVAACSALPGSFVDIKGSDGSPWTVKIHATDSGDPATNGDVYDLSVRYHALALGAGAKVSGLQTQRAISNDGGTAGSSQAGLSLSQMILKDGTKHNIVIGSGTLRDSVMIENDPVTPYQVSNTGYAAYIPDPTADSILIERVGAVNLRALDFLAHGNSGLEFLNATIRQCWTINTDFANIPGGTNIRLGEGCYYRGVRDVTLQGAAKMALVYSTLERSAPATTYPCVYENCAWYVETRYAAGNYLEVFRAGYPFTFDHCAFAGFDLYDKWFYNSTVSSGVITYSHTIFLGGYLHHQIPAGASYAGDYNVFWSTTADLFAFFSQWHGDFYTTLAAWQTATGQDANSVTLATADQTSSNPLAFWLGVSSGANDGPKDGDWRINPSCRVYDGANVAHIGQFPDGTPITQAGAQNHWDWNARAAVAGPPTAYPTVPTTVADAQEYIANPAAWNFYP